MDGILCNTDYINNLNPKRVEVQCFTKGGLGYLSMCVDRKRVKLASCGRQHYVEVDSLRKSAQGCAIARIPEYNGRIIDMELPQDNVFIR